jgi:hypothetical protein
MLITIEVTPLSEIDSFGDDSEILHQATEKLLLDVISIAQNLENNNLNKASSYTQQSKIAYILWMYPATRDSYVALALKFYEIFYPENINGNSISLDSFFKVPKMYDIQRTSAKLQNQMKWCPPTETGKARRGKRQDAKFEQYSSVVQLRHDSEIYVYIDESGKTDEYFILGGVSFSTNYQVEDFEYKLSQSVGDGHREFKFKEITSGNVENYKKFINEVLTNYTYIRFYSVILQNKDLAKESKVNKTQKCSVALFRDISYHYIQQGSTLKLNVVFDVDGPGLDPLEQEELRNFFNQELTKEYGSLCQVSGTKWRASNELFSLQLADLFSSSLNNIYSKSVPESNTAKVKREFAEWFLSNIGFDTKINKFLSNNVVNRIISK